MPKLKLQIKFQTLKCQNSGDSVKEYDSTGVLIWQGEDVGGGAGLKPARARHAVPLPFLTVPHHILYSGLSRSDAHFKGLSITYCLI